MPKTVQNGKGSTPRPVNTTTYTENYTHAFEKEKCSCKECISKKKEKEIEKNDRN